MKLLRLAAVRQINWDRRQQTAGETVLPTLGWGKHRGRLYAGRSSGQKPGPTFAGPRAEGQREEMHVHSIPGSRCC